MRFYEPTLLCVVVFSRLLHVIKEFVSILTCSLFLCCVLLEMGLQPVASQDVEFLLPDFFV